MLGDTHRAFTSDLVHSCLQFHPQSSRPRHAGWTSLFLHHHLTPSLSDSFSPSIHGVSPLQLSGIQLPGPRQNPALGKAWLTRPGTTILPILFRDLAPEPLLAEVRVFPPSLSSHRHPDVLLTLVLCSMGLPHGGGAVVACVPWWVCELGGP